MRGGLSQSGINIYQKIKINKNEINNRINNFITWLPWLQF